MGLPACLGIVYLVSELALAITRHSRATGQDRYTLVTIWLVILISAAAAMFIAMRSPLGSIPANQFVRATAVGLFVAGLVLRWWSIIVLGRFFTVDVQVGRNHLLVDRGPFRFVRHPSYTGVLLAFAGFALLLRNWILLLVVMVPITLAFVRRMNVEEEALIAGLGAPYVDYMSRTKRLIPWIY